MSLNVKDPEARRLAKAIARETGESLTRVVTEVLRERLARLERQRGRASVGKLHAIAARTAALVHQRYATHGDLLYDGDGLPK